MPTLRRITDAGVEEVFFTQEAVPLALKQGWELPPDEKVFLTDQFGNPFAADPGRAQVLLDQGAASLESQASLDFRNKEHRLEKEYGEGLLNDVRAATEGGLRGLTFGLSDLALEALGADEEGLRQRAQRNPVASIGGELVGGVLLPLGAAKGAAGAFGKVVRNTPAGIAFRAGERAAARVAASTGSGLRAAATGAGVEGSIFGAGQGLSNVILSDKPLSAEAIISEMGSGALFGGALGAGLGAAENVLAKGANRLSKKLAEKAAPVLKKGTKEYDELVSTFSLASKRLDGAVSDARASLDASRQSLRALGETSENLAKLDEAIQIVDDKAPKFQELVTSKSIDDLRTLPEPMMEDAYRAAIEFEGAAQRAINTLDDGAAVKLADELASYKEALTPHTPSLGPVEVAALANELGVIDVDQVPLVGGPAETLLRVWAGARILNVASGGKGSKLIGSIARRGASSAGFTGGIEVGKRAGAGRFATGALGGAFAAVGARAAEGSAGALRGAAAFSGRAFDKIDRGISALARSKAPRAARVSAVKLMERASFGVEVDKKSVPRRKTESAIQHLYRVQTRAVLTAASNPEVARQEIRRKLEDVGVVDPVLADQLEHVAMRRIEFLASQVPRRLKIDPLAPDEYRPSAHEIDQFVRVLRATEDPVGEVMRGLQSGQMKLATAEAIQSVYPNLFAEIQRRLVTDHDLLRDLNYRQKLSFSILFDIPIERTMDPDVVTATAQRFLQLAEQGQGPQSPSAAPPPQRTRDRALTPAQRLQE